MPPTRVGTLPHKLIPDKMHALRPSNASLPKAIMLQQCQDAQRQHHQHLDTMTPGVSAWGITEQSLGSHLPARSTRFSAPLRWVPEASWRPVMASMNTECEREELAFMAVASHARAIAAFRTSAAATSEEVTGVTVAPTTWVCPPA